MLDSDFGGLFQPLEFHNSVIFGMELFFDFFLHCGDEGAVWSLKEHQTSTTAHAMRGKFLHFLVSIPIFVGFSCFCVSWQVLSCLVQIASVRRSLFNNAERAKFLSHLVDGVKRILENPQVSIPPRLCILPVTFHPKKNPFRVPLGHLAKGRITQRCSALPFSRHSTFQGRFMVDIRNNFSIGRVIKDWNHPWKCPKTRKCGNS